MMVTKGERSWRNWTTLYIRFLLVDRAFSAYQVTNFRGSHNERTPSMFTPKADSNMDV